MSFRTHRLRRSQLTSAILATLLLPLASSVFAQEQQSGEEEQQEQSSSQEAEELQKIEVVGSRIKRADVEGPSPVTIISSEQIEREGFNTVYDALNTLSQATGNVQNELFQSGFTPNAQVINLRGLGPGRTLLLINGRRAADYPLPYNGQSNFANFGNIPAAAVDRIEVLAGGASAIYGSDAVAGVINVVLKTNLDGDVLSVRGQTTTRGGRDIANVSWVGGKTGDNWGVTYALQYYYSEPLYAYQRDFMDSLLDNPLPNAITGQQPFGTMRLRNRTRTTNNYFAPPAGACEQFGDEWVRWNFRSATGANLGESCGTFKDVGYQAIANSNNDISAYIHGTYDFANGMQAWASLQAWDSNAKATSGTQFWFGPSDSTIWFDPQFGTFVDAQRIFVPAESGGQDSLNQKFDERSYDLAVGLRGTMFNDRFDWDVTLSRAEYDVEVRRPRFVASAVNNFFVGQRLGTQSGFPVYRLNLNNYYRRLTPQEFAGLTTTVKTEADSYVNQGSFVLSGDLFELPAGPVGFAAVLEGSQQAYDLNADPRILPDRREIYNLTGTGGGGERDRYAAGVEVAVPILDSLKVSAAARFDKYDDVTEVDDAFTWNAGLEWRPIDSLLVRGSYSTSFRAPDLHFVFAERSGSFSTVFDTRRCLESGRSASQCTGDPNVNYTSFGVRQGTKNLEEEEGNSWTAGVVWDVTDNLSISADYYEIELEGAVADITTAYILDNEAGCVTGLTRQRQPFQFAPGSAFCQDILARVSRISAPGTTQDGQISEIRRGPINRAFLGTKGIDASLNYSLDTDRLGDFRFIVQYSHTLEQTTAEFKGDPIIDYRDDLTNFDFRSRIRATATWERDDWQAALFMGRWGSLPNWQETGRIAPYFVWNTSFGKEIVDDKARVTFYVNNIFNKTHPRDEGFDSYPYFWRAYSPIGREIGVQFDYKFN